MSQNLSQAHTIAKADIREVHILLADDDSTNQKVAKRHLRKTGYQVDLAENGQEAVEAYKRKNYDLILMDLQMPVMDGYHATKATRNLEAKFEKINDEEKSAKLKRVPIIAMTSDDMESYREKCKEAGMDDYIAKPLRKKELLAMVEKWVISNVELGMGNEECEMSDPNPDNSEFQIPNSKFDQDAPMNFERAIKEFEGDKEFLMEVLKDFLKNTEARIGTIRQALPKRDAEVVKREAHSIRGSAADLTAHELSSTAFELENIVKSGFLEGDLKVLERLEKEFNRLKDYAGDRKNIKEMKTRILVVDDELVTRKKLQKIMDSLGNCEAVGSGEEALKIATSENPPDLILLDLVMPGMDGYQVIHRLMADRRTQNIPVIFVTVASEEEDETKGLELGAVDYIAKPISPAIVKARVRTHLELRKHHDHLEELVKDRSKKLVKANEQMKQEIEERKRAEEELKASLKEKEVLLSEIHHRVGNNMQVISSLLQIQSDKIQEKEYADMFKESNDRIRSMSLVYEKLYRSKDFANVDFNGYAKSLVNRLFRSYGIDTNKIKAKIEVEDVSLGVDTAVPCGLLINELVSNSLKYAFPEGREGELRISLRSINEDDLELIVSDDGIGIPEDLDIKNTESFGMELISILAEEQLEGKIELDRTAGTRYQIRLKRQKYRPRI